MSQENLWERFLKPVFNNFLLDKEQLKKSQAAIDWEKDCQRLRDPALKYPDYYTSKNFHGISGGYLNSTAAVTYDPITQYVLPPNETWVRQALINSIEGYPNKIIDLGCGTGTTTLMLKKAFPNAQVMGLDLSPYMLAMAHYKAKGAGLAIDWRHGIAEKTGLAASSMDVVTISLLFHEIPSVIAKAILQECFRLLSPGGQILILDGNQKTLRRTEWLNSIFEEPYIQEYAQGNLDAWLGLANFEAVRTEELWWLHQISQARKPLPITEPVASFAYGLA